MPTHSLLLTLPLTAEQRAIVDFTAPIIVINAGAGVGKTTVLLAKAYFSARLLKRGQKVLILTFSTESANDARQRLSKIWPQASIQVEVRTIHAFGHKMVHQYPQELGYPQPPNQVSQGSEKDEIEDRFQQAFPRSGVTAEQYQTLLRITQKAIGYDLDIQREMANHCPELLSHAQALTQIAAQFKESKRQAGRITFSDQLRLPLKLFDQHPEILEDIGRQYPVLLVDECQDLSAIQLELVKQLATVIPNVVVVGDDGQTIYGFRGATPNNLRRFRLWFPAAKVAHLTASQRCSQPILDVANVIRREMPGVTLLALTSANPDISKRPLYLHCASADLQHQAVLRVVRQLMDRKGLCPSEITILARNKVNLRELHRYLEVNGVSTVLGHRRMLDKLCDATQQLLAAMAEETPDLGQLLAALGLATGSKSRLNYLARKIAQAKSCRYNEEKLDLIKDCLVSMNRRDKQFITADINRFKHLTRACSTLAEVSEVIERYRQECQKSVALQTIHSAKGLENRAVILTDLVDGEFPHKLTRNTPAGIEEERRLFYVGVTRAEEYLCLLSRPVARDNRETKSVELATQDCQLLSAKVKSQCRCHWLSSAAEVEQLFQRRVKISRQ